MSPLHTLACGNLAVFSSAWQEAGVSWLPHHGNTNDSCDQAAYACRNGLLFLLLLLSSQSVRWSCFAAEDSCANRKAYPCIAHTHECACHPSSSLISTQGPAAEGRPACLQCSASRFVDGQSDHMRPAYGTSSCQHWLSAVSALLHPFCLSSLNMLTVCQP